MKPGIKSEAGESRAPFAFNAGTVVLPAKDAQHAWFELTRARPWTSVALVPVEDTSATLALGHDMARMAALDPRNRVLLINATGVVSGDSLQVAPQAPAAPGSVPSGIVPMANGKYWLLDCARLGMDDAHVGMVEVPRHIEAMQQGKSTYTRIIVTLSSPLVRPASVSAARAVEAAALCITLGLTNFTDAQRTIELIGEERLVGAISMRAR